MRQSNVICSKLIFAQEIILHTLFESGTTRIYELDSYIKDDVIRYGGRLAELEKKLANAYRDAVSHMTLCPTAHLTLQVADHRGSLGR